MFGWFSFGINLESLDSSTPTWAGIPGRIFSIAVVFVITVDL